MLFLPGNTPNIIQNGDALLSDAVILDLEDAVAPDQKDAARILVRNALKYLDFSKVEVIVRINSVDTAFWKRDLDELMPLRPSLIMFISLDPQSKEPLYRQIAEAIERELADGRLQPGDKLPTVRELAQELSAAQGTIKRAYDELHHRGVIEMAQGRGTFIAEREQPDSRKERAMLVLEDGQVAYGDCAAVQYSGAGGRDPLFLAKDFIPIIEQHIRPVLVGQEADNFRRLSALAESITVDGKRLHTAIRYGVTQALLDAVARSSKRLMCEVVADEYGCTVSDKPIDIFTQSGDNRYDNADKMIIKGAQVMTWAELRDFAVEGRVELGCHSYYFHHQGARLGASRRRGESRGAWLEALCGDAQAMRPCLKRARPCSSKTGPMWCSSTSICPIPRV